MYNALDFADTIALLQELGISLMTDDGKYRDLIDILDELAHKWNRCFGASKSRRIGDAADAIIYAYRLHAEIDLLTPDEDGEDELTKFLSGFRII